MKQIKWRPLLTSILAAHLAGQVARLLAGDMAGVYAVMTVPPFSPPGWMFRPVWLALYTLMGIAAYRVWDADGAGRRNAIRLYGAQKVLNGLWPMLFFRWGNGWLAVAAVFALAGLVFLTMRRFRAIDPAAGRLIVPYLVWVGYMVYLTVGFLVVG
ncbi:MAG: tryptophan-rich sensory protein [Oscillospiraceae bacterium]|nr:tryptophan-rich sensory protein [Oscillospiraceae bacterium]